MALVLSLSMGTFAHPKAESKDIVNTAVSAGAFKTLVVALQVAGLVDILKGKAPFHGLCPHR
jgi:uncharacterized surface protein with fasciclin (FAS1) repeats